MSAFSLRPFLLLLLLAADACAQTTPALRQAESLLTSDKPLEAEKAFRGLLTTTSGGEREFCYDRLMTIYIRLGRFDAAIRNGLEFEAFLRRRTETDRLRQLQYELGWCWYTQGHDEKAADWLGQAVDPKGGRLVPETRMQALGILARVADRRRQPQVAREYRESIREESSRLLQANTLPIRERYDLVSLLGEACSGLNEHSRNIAECQKLLPILERGKEPTLQRSVLRQLSKALVEERDYPQAVRVQQQAIEVHAKIAPRDRNTAAELNSELAEIHRRSGDRTSAAKSRQKAIELLQQVLRTPNPEDAVGGGTVNSFWKLISLLEVSSQYRLALDLAGTQAQVWSGQELLETRLRTEMGSLELFLGSYTKAEGLLRTAIKSLEAQDPPSLSELPRALVNLAIVELAGEQLGEAEKLAKQCQQIYRKYNLNPDLVLIDTWIVLGTCSAQQGKYPDAIKLYRLGLDSCKKLGPVADPQQSNILLNIAVLHKAQNDIPQALEVCSQALEIFRRFAEPDDVGFAAFEAAIAGMHAVEMRLSESAASAEKVLEICARQRIDSGPLVTTALHSRALYLLSQKNLVAAEKDWLEVLRLQRAEKQSILLPRTLNYLGMTAEFRHDLKAAKEYYEEAVERQSNNARAFPVTSFNSHWLLATLLHNRGQTRQAVELLEKAATVVEAARLNTWGDSQQRAGYFAQFAPGFEALVQWYVELGDKENAVVSAIRGRSRTLLDQLQLSGVDPKAGLKGTPEGDKLLAREDVLRQKLNSLRARGQSASSGSLTAEKSAELVRDFDAAQKEYAALWREILRENPLYQNLSEENPRQVLAGLQKKVIAPSGVMLLYYVGRDHSWLFTVGDTARGIAVWPLSIPEDIQNNATLLQERTLGQSLAGARGMSLVRREVQPEAPAAEVAASKQVPLTSRGARILVDTWSTAISQPDFQPTRGMRLESRTPSKPVATQRADLPGEIFLPSAVRERLSAAAGVDHLLVIPDGPLHRVPLEALIISRDGRPRYLLDELPPVIYSPSATILNLVTTRPAPDLKRTRTLLTVADPAYPVDTIGAITGVGNYARSAESMDSALLSSRMPRLPFTATESQAVRRFFASKDVEVLENTGATEKRVTTAIAGRTIVHIAAHGFADERFGNLFGALALTPPSRVVSSDDDGFLSLNEINDLQLKDCELAVLSACVTNVGPQRPLEAGVTLANGFLAAGARRVIASHWSVDDRSTSLLMEDFFARLSTTRGTPREYAKALHDARLKLRNDPQYAAPFYWAPFVLTGSAD